MPVTMKPTRVPWRNIAVTLRPSYSQVPIIYPTVQPTLIVKASSAAAGGGGLSMTTLLTIGIAVLGVVALILGIVLATCHYSVATDKDDFMRYDSFSIEEMYQNAWRTGNFSHTVDVERSVPPLRPGEAGPARGEVRADQMVIEHQLQEMS